MKRSNLIMKWWLGVDKWLLWTVIILSITGLILVASASPTVATRIGLAFNHFTYNHLFYLIIAQVIMILYSSASPAMIKKISFVSFVILIIMLIAVLQLGNEVKGAKRWIYIFGFSLQPSEFIKPVFAIVNAAILSMQNNKKYTLSLSLYLLILILLIIEPDFGMSTVLSLIWIGQIFITNIPILYLLILVLIITITGVISYNIFPHVQHRISNFLNPELGDNFQVHKSLDAFANGGITGMGPGKGIVKRTIPDVHSDFIFAAAGEEFGAITCLIIIILITLFITRAAYNVIMQDDDFTIIAVFGILIQITSQSLINIGVSLHLLPTKGMTLPFISYGGSSTLANAIGIGMTLALTKTQFNTKLRN